MIVAGSNIAQKMQDEEKRQVSMSAPRYGRSGDESLKDRDAAPAREITLHRSDYAKIRADYHHIAAEGLLQKPLDRKHAKVWAHAQQDFEDALFELLPRSGFGTVILDPTDTRTEYARVTNAVIALHDWLRLYQELIKQPLPEGLRVIERKLSDRRDELNCLYPPEAHQPD